MNNENEALQLKVNDALRWEPLLLNTAINATVHEGCVTLNGEVDIYPQKVEAVHSVRHVAGVKEVIDNVLVVIDKAETANDRQMQQQAIQALRWNWMVPYNKVQVAVKKGWLTLSGELQWNYQKTAAYEIVKHITGVTDVINQIGIKSGGQDALEQSAIEYAIGRCSLIRNEDIAVNVNGNKVILNGRVQNYHQKAEAERIAWNARGVEAVDNELSVNC